MSQASTQGTRLFAIVEPESAAVETVEHALREARDWHAETGEPITVAVLVVAASADRADETAMTAEIEDVVASFDAPTAVRTSVRLLPVASEDPTVRTDALLDHVGDHEPARLVVGSGHEFEMERLREEVGVTAVESGPPVGNRERRHLVHPGGARRLVTIFSLAYLFYLAIGGFAGGLDFLTGAISAGVVAVSLSHVALRDEPTLSRTVPRVVRLLCFLPVLLWEIAKANVVIAYVILHPKLPIAPSMGTMETDTHEGLERMVLANSITLTPGTLTIDVDEREFVVHSLTAGGLQDLESGRIPRFVSWVFHGSTPPTGDGDGGDDR